MFSGAALFVCEKIELLCTYGGPGVYSGTHASARRTYPFRPAIGSAGPYRF